MSQRLYEKYFPFDDEKEDQSLRVKWLERVEKLRSLVQSPGWPELTGRLDELIRRSEVRPGSEQTMLYEIGRREALREFRDLFSVMEQELKNERQAGH